MLSANRPGMPSPLPLSQNTIMHDQQGPVVQNSSVSNDEKALLHSSHCNHMPLQSERRPPAVRLSTAEKLKQMKLQK